MSEQLILPLNENDITTFDGFIANENSDLLNTLNTSMTNAIAGSYYIWGKRVVGKTHLLQACCSTFSATNGIPCYIPLRDSLHKKLDLNQIDTSSLVCIDDIESIALNKEWEEKIFHLYNHIKEDGGLLVISGTDSPLNLNITLNDLRSRLTWGLVYQLSELDEDGKILVLTNIANKIGLHMPNDVANYLLTRCSRNLSDLIAILKVVAKSAFAEQRKLTIPYVKEVIGI